MREKDGKNETVYQSKSKTIHNNSMGLFFLKKKCMKEDEDTPEQ